jgi:polysaccharide biosynthesis/export protein
MRNVFRLLAACALALFVGSCIGGIPSPFRPYPGPREAPQISDLAQAFDIVCRNYKLGPDDQLNVLFQPQWSIPAGTYKLDTLDRIRVKFILDPQLNEDVVIRPDGMITLQAIGEIHAAGLTPTALASRIEERFIQANIFSKEETRGELKNYRLVTVHVISFYQKLKRLVQSLTTLTNGSVSAVTVKPDGTLDLPLLKDRVLAAGHTVREVEDTINRLYRTKVLPYIVVSLSLSKAQSRKVYVMGQVVSPGAYQIDQPITALQAIAMAGGEVHDFADLTSVILISKDINGRPIGRRLDLKKTLDMGDMGSEILVKPYDVLYVPRTYVGDLRLFMDQYISTITQFKSLIDSFK